jgi:serine/threonine protein kinase
MAESQSTASVTRPPPDPPSKPDDAADLGVLNAAPTDDSPTIISKNAPRLGDAPGVPLRGRRLAHFELIEPIGVGGMAAVIRARDTQLDRLVALKILPAEMAVDQENVQRFHQEARSAAKLDHENVARVFFCGEDQRLHFIAFEFVEGDNLRTILERRGRLPAATAVNYTLQIAAGLAHAAQRGVVHRDVKPSNIIVTPTGRAKLVDMGLARSMGPQDHALTQSGVTLGTFDYISPEQALEPRDADVRSDIYSLGCTLYHMLTGQAPVPEGTAAKKLHHHQHLKPADPRDLTPGLPDDVVVILNRMMAKRPQDRYPSPEPLVHDLLTAARRMGAVSDVPEGVRSAEAALPHPSNGRPLLFAGLAAALVVALVVLVEVFNKPSAAPTNSVAIGPLPDAPKDKAPASQNQQPVPPADGLKDKGALDRPRVDPPADAVYSEENPTQHGLTDWLNAHKGANRVVIELARDLDVLLSSDEAGLVVSAAEVVVRPKENAPRGRRPTIRFHHNSPTQTKPWAALTLECQKAEVQGVRFLVDASSSDVEMIGLQLRGRARDRCDFTVEKCEFLQTHLLRSHKKRVASLEADLGDADTALLDLKEDCFLCFQEATEALTFHGLRDGHDAVVRRGAVKVKAADCAFGPHLADFRLEGKGAPSTAVEHCTLLVASDRAAAFDFGVGAGGRLDFVACLFARLGVGDAEAPSVVIRQADREPTVVCKDQDGRYYGFDAYWSAPGLDGSAGWADFQMRAEATDSDVAAALPWKENLADALRDYDPAKTPPAPAVAFQVNPQALDLRTRDRTRPVGVERFGGFEVLAPADRQDPLAKNVHIVDPSADDAGPRVHPTLEAAVVVAQPGDVILIKDHGTPLKVEPLLFNRNKPIDLTIRPYPGRRPVLTLATREADPALFRIFDGKLQLEGLEFQLQPADDFHSQAVVALAGSGQCVFRNCVVTLDPNKRRTALSLATLSDGGKLMMKPTDQAPQLTLENCFVRGDGDLLTCGGGRPVELTVTNTLAAIKGSFVNVEASSADAGPAGASGPIALNLRKVTAVVGGNLLHVRGGKEAKALPAVHAAPSACLFVAAKTDGKADPQPLIQLDECDFDESIIKTKLQWEGAGNVYGNVLWMLSETPSDEGMTLAPVAPDKWDAFWGKTSGATGKLQKPFRFAGGAWPEAPYTRSFPNQFRPEATLEAGADLAALPKPADAK